MDSIPIDNKVGENYFGEMSNKLRKKGGAAFKAVGEKLVLSSNADIAFCDGAREMLKDKELKCKRKQIEQIEADWSKAQKDVMKAKISVSDAHADILAREQSKNKVLSQCVENGKKFKYDSPVSSQNDVNKMFTKIQKLNEQDQLSVMRREIKLKKLIFSDLPSDFILLKQYNITAKQMFQNLLALHAVDPSNQETITVEDIYEVTDSLSMLPLMTGLKKPRSKSNTSQQASAETVRDFEWPPHEEEFVITLEENGWNLGSVVTYEESSDTIQVQILETIKTRAKDDDGKVYWVYCSEESIDTYEEKNVLDVRPSVTLAKNIKKKDPVFALLNREMIEAVSTNLYA